MTDEKMPRAERLRRVGDLYMHYANALHRMADSLSEIGGVPQHWGNLEIEMGCKIEEASA